MCIIPGYNIPVVVVVAAAESGSHAMPAARRIIAFARHKCLAAGDPAAVARALTAIPEAVRGGQVVVLDTVTAEPVELDLRGSADQAAARAAVAEAARTAAPPPRPGRPRLGVTAREVTLLPRHWDWLGAQPGGASVTLRKLVDAARRGAQSDDATRLRQDRAYRFLAAVAGDLPGYEETIRALYAWDLDRLDEQSHGWPADVRRHLLSMLQADG